MFTQPGLARRAARRVQRHEAMDARVRLSSLDSCRIILIDDAVMKARGWTTELLLRHEIGATATADRAIILVSAHRG